jgi:integrase
VSRTYIYTRQVWHNAFVKACRYGIAAQNPLDLCERVSYKKKRSKALTIAEQRAFMERLEQSRVKWLMLFYLQTGTRRNEALTLEWQDIDESEKIIHIKGTKTENSCRDILLTNEVKAILEGQRKQTEADEKTKYKSKHPERVFPYSANYISQAFKKLCGSHHLHELRHTFITRCAESGVNVNVCQQLVGHSSPALTLEVYTHVMDDFKRKEAAKFSLFPVL